MDLKEGYVAICDARHISLSLGIKDLRKWGDKEE